jgi:NAD(P)-dependent dehydrogenase (short-subunit alcohol dehydrogenase family)
MRRSFARLKHEYPHANLTTLRGSIADEAGCGAIAAQLRTLARPLAGIVVAKVADKPRGRVIEQSPEVLRAVLEAEVLPHLAAARALVPVIGERGRNASYVVIGGPGGEQPWAGYGLKSIAAASVSMLLRVLHDEARALGVRVQLLAVEKPARTGREGEHACAHWPSAVAIGRRALELVDQVDTREPAAAVVRYAPNEFPPLPGQRSRQAASLPPVPAQLRLPHHPRQAWTTPGRC